MSNDQRVHEVISALKDLAITLGQTPTKAECLDRGVVRTDHELKKLFGSYAQLVQQSGLDPRKVNNKKLDLKNMFNTSIDRHLENYQPKQILRPASTQMFAMYPKIASISDIHWPFCSEKVVNAFIEFCRVNQPEYIVLNGDAWDMYSYARFPRSHNQFTPREEMARARAANVEFWQRIKKVCPKAKCYQMLGNHDVRPMKKIMDTFPEAEDFVKKQLTEMFTFPGVHTFFDVREELMVGDIAIFHGYRSKLGDHRDHTGYNCMIGHTHRGGTVFRQLHGKVLWELNSGLAGDPLAKGLTYTPQKITEWTPGFSFCDTYGPRFIMVL